MKLWQEIMLFGGTIGIVGGAGLAAYPYLAKHASHEAIGSDALRPASRLVCADSEFYDEDSTNKGINNNGYVSIVRVIPDSTDAFVMTEGGSYLSAQGVIEHYLSPDADLKGQPIKECNSLDGHVARMAGRIGIEGDVYLIDFYK